MTSAIRVKNAGEWVQVYPHPPLPTAPVLTATGVGNGISLTWTAGTVAAGSIGSYEVENVPLPYNEATGGTVKDFTRDGNPWRRHTFLTGADLTVAKNPKPFTVYLIGGGGGGGKNGFDGGGPHGGGKGGGGGYYSSEVTLAVGVAPVVVGGAGTAGTNTSGGAGGDSSVGNLKAGGGGGGAWGQDAIIGGFGRSGVPTPAANGGNGGGNNHPQTSPCTGKQAALGLATTVGEGGVGGAPDGGQASNPGAAGNAGAVVVEYEVAS